MQEAIEKINQMLEEGRFEDAIGQAEPILAAATANAGLLGTVRQLAEVLRYHCYLLAVRKHDNESLLLEDPLRRACALLGEDIYGNRIR
jgi:hypothetical protein